MSTDSIGLTLGVATIAGISGGALAARVGTRFGRTVPVLSGLALLGLSGAAVAVSHNAAQFVSAQIAFACAFLLATPYLMGTAAALDLQGRVAALLSVFGYSAKVREDQMNAATAATAVGPTYILPVIKTLDRKSVV
jgi:MFS family permease